MKMILISSCLLIGSWAIAADVGGGEFGYLSKEDQKYYKNDSFEGSNQRERLDSTVKEINKLHGEIKSMKEEINGLKKEIELLKSKK
jgi:peptidoglycan hydrolase CwlO-like protein